MWRPVTTIEMPTTGVWPVTGDGTTSLIDPSSDLLTVILNSSRALGHHEVVATLKNWNGGVCTQSAPPKDFSQWAQ